MGAFYENTDGMQAFVYANGDLMDTLNRDDLKEIHGSPNIAEAAIREALERGQ